MPGETEKKIKESKSSSADRSAGESGRQGNNSEERGKEGKKSTGSRMEILLPPEKEAYGVRRFAPVPLAEGMNNDAPAITVSSSGRIFIAFVSRSGDDRETILLRQAPDSMTELRPPRPMSEDYMAWNPVLASGPDDAVWLSWCGGDKLDFSREGNNRNNREEQDNNKNLSDKLESSASGPDFHRRTVYLRRVWPPPVDEIIIVADGPGRQCDPSISVSAQGIVHVAWEAEDRIAWRAFSGEGKALSEAITVSGGPFDRRPSVLADKNRLHLAWDRLDSTVRKGAQDPRYDLLYRYLDIRPEEKDADIEKDAGINNKSAEKSRKTDRPEKSFEWGEIIEIDAGGGIRAAPALVQSPDGNGVLIAYHTTDRHPLVKWWRLRRITDKGEIEELALHDEAGERIPEGEQQGAEFPAIAAGPGNRLAIVTRPSQGAYLHLVDADGVSPPLDLTRRGWGARGIRAGAAFAPDGILHVVRRARHESVHERFSFSKPGAGLAPFSPITESSRIINPSEGTSTAVDTSSNLAPETSLSALTNPLTPPEASSPVSTTSNSPPVNSFSASNSASQTSTSPVSSPEASSPVSTTSNSPPVNSFPASKTSTSPVSPPEASSSVTTGSSSEKFTRPSNMSDEDLYRADPKVLGQSRKKYRIVLGDIHMHSALSDGTGPGDEIYARARVRGMDFAVLTDHDYIVGSRMFPSKYAEIIWLTDWFNRLENFATLHGFEWTTPPVPRGYGHRNVYYRDYPRIPLPGSRDGYPDTPSLNRAVSEEKAFTAAHHAAWTGTDWENFDPDIQRHIEIVSVHGAFERTYMEEAPIEPRGDHVEGMAVHGLNLGHVFGFLGGSDSHGLLWHHGLARRPDPWDQGLTGVIVPELTRHALWDAMYSRLTYATSGAPMILQVSVSGFPMGSEGLISKKSGITAAGGDNLDISEKIPDYPPLIRWSWKTTAAPNYIMVYRNGEEIYKEKLEAVIGSGLWRDESAKSGKNVYYVRLVQGEGPAGVDIAWSSPVFLIIERN